MKQWIKEVIHNCIIHPMLPFLPLHWAIQLHQWNGKWTFGEHEPR